VAVELAVQALERAGSAEDLLRAGELPLELEQALARGDLREPGRAHLLRGLALVRLERWESGREALRRVMESKPSDSLRNQAEHGLAWLDSQP
jgi:hypothetical protein